MKIGAKSATRKPMSSLGLKGLAVQNLLIFQNNMLIAINLLTNFCRFGQPKLGATQEKIDQLLINMFPWSHCVKPRRPLGPGGLRRRERKTKARNGGLHTLRGLPLFLSLGLHPSGPLPTPLHAPDPLPRTPPLRRIINVLNTRVQKVDQLLINFSTNRAVNMLVNSRSNFCWRSPFKPTFSMSGRLHFIVRCFSFSDSVPFLKIPCFPLFSMFSMFAVLVSCVVFGKILVGHHWDHGEKLNTPQNQKNIAHTTSHT